MIEPRDKVESANKPSSLRSVRASWIAWLTALDVGTAASLATIIGLVVAVVAGGIAWITYTAAERDARAADTLAYKSRLDSGELGDALFEVTQARSSYDWKEIERPDSSQNLPKLMAKLDAAYHLKMPALRLADFFDEFYVCARLRICDLRLGLRLLGPDLDGIYEVTNWYVKEAAGTKKYEYQIGCGERALEHVFLEGSPSWSVDQLRACPGM